MVDEGFIIPEIKFISSPLEQLVQRLLVFQQPSQLVYRLV